MSLIRAMGRWPAGWLLLVIVQWPLVLNPGWLSHDELQWAARAALAPWSELPWVAWGDWQAFQYRPLTFNLWLVLAHALAAHPFLLHGVFVGLGSLDALLLASVVRATGARTRVAAVAALVFVLSPYASYVHGWVATLGDLLVATAALVGLRLLQRASRESARAWPAALALPVLVTLALLAKEAAIVLPVALLPALYRAPRPRRVLALIALAGVPVLAYLALRLPVLWSVPAGDASYAWRLAHVPARLAEYLLYPFLPPLFEVAPTLAKSVPRLAAAAACLVALLAALATRGWRWPLAWLALYTLLLAPVLVLATSYDQYAYLASAGTVGCVATAWPHLGRGARAAIALVALVVVAHGLAVMQRMHAAGAFQARFTADWRELVARGAGLPCITLADERDRWLIERLVHEVPQHAGACLAPAGSTTRLLLQRDGHLVLEPR